MENILIPPVSEDFKKFTQQLCKLIDWNETINNKLNLKWYIYKNVVCDEQILRGYFENQGIDVNESFIVSSFPKTGTTWLQEITFLIANDGDISKSDSVPINIRVPFIEFLVSLTVADVNKRPSPKLLKTHLPLSLLTEAFRNKKFKILYICRNPKDTITSYYFFYKMVKTYNFTGNISEMVDLFVNDLVAYSPFAKHVLEYWEKSKTDDNILFLHYEELQLDLKSSVKKIAQFMGKKLTEHQIEKITNRCTFASMSANAMSNYSHFEDVAFNTNVSKFMRKGKVGDWKNHLNKEDNQKMDEWIDENFKNTDFKFIYE